MEYTFHISSGLGHVTAIPYYIKNNEVCYDVIIIDFFFQKISIFQVTYSRAFYLVAMLLWTTFPVAAICCFTIRTVKTWASMANSEVIRHFLQSKSS